MSKIAKIIMFVFLFFVFVGTNAIVGFAASLQTSNVNSFINFNVTEYSITYYLLGGQNNYANPILYRSNTPTIELQAPTKLDYTFAGWFDNPSYSGLPVLQIAKGSSGNKSFYAKWDFDYTQELTFAPSGTGGYIVSDASVPDNVTKVVIPSSFNGIPVTELASSGFRDNQNIESVTIENGPVAMGGHVFRDCINLSVIELPASLPEIPVHAFNGCVSLSALIINRSIVQHGSITLGATQMLANTPDSFYIYVPDDSINEYKTSSRWSAYASRIYPLSMIVEDYAVEPFESGLRIVQYVGTTESISIPSILNGQQVVAIGADAFRLNKVVKKVLINNYVESIGNNAFEGASNLVLLGVSRTMSVGITTAGASILSGTNASLSILVSPDSLTAYRTASNWSLYASRIFPPPVHESGFVFEEIEGGIALLKYVGNSQMVVIPSQIDAKPVIKMGAFLFSAASQDIIGVTIPNTVMQIDKVAFNYNAKLENIDVSESNNYYSSASGVLFNKNKTSLLLYPEGKMDDTYTIPSTVTALEEYSFFRVQSLRKVVLPNGLTSIKARSFYEMLYVQEIALPSSVQTIGNEAFAFSPKLKRLFINRSSASGLTTVGVNAFTGIHTAVKVYVEDSSLTAYQAASNWSVLAASMYSQNIIVGNYAVLDYQTGVQILQYLGEETHVHMPSQINNKDILKIADYAFAENESFKHVELPSTVIEVGDYAFAHTHNSTYVRLNASAQPIVFGTNVFVMQHPAFRIYAPSEHVSVYQNQTNLSDVGTLIESLSIIYGDYAIKQQANGVLILQYLGHSAVVSIPSILNAQTVIGIASFAFWSQNVIEKLTFPNTLQFIGERAFEGCAQISQLTFPSALESIGNQAFYNCERLRSIVVERANAIAITQAGFDFLFGTPVAIKIYVPTSSEDDYKQAANWNSYASSIYPQSIIFANYAVMQTVNGYKILQYLGEQAQVIIPSSINGQAVVALGEYAFACSYQLTHVTVPASITAIESYAFGKNMSLQSITLLNTSTENITTAGLNLFMMVNTNFQIKVHASCVNIYKTAVNWNQFAARIVAI